MDLTYYDGVSKIDFIPMDKEKINLPCKDAGFELPRMALHHIAMRVNTTKKIGPAVYVKHHTLATRRRPFPRIVIALHLNPFIF